MTQAISIIAAAFMIAFQVYAEDLSFPDSKGKIALREKNIVVRMVDVHENRIKKVEAVFLLKASPEQVYRMVTDYENYPAFMPNISEAALQNRNGSACTYRFCFNVAGFNTRYTVALTGRHTEQSKTVQWRFVDGDIKYTKGSWLISSDPARTGLTRVRYSTFTDPGKFVPAFVVNRLVTKSIPKMVRALQHRIKMRDQAIKDSVRNEPETSKEDT